MKTYLYPAYFRHTKNGGYSVDFPDLPGCVTAGDTLKESLSMAREALSLHLYGMIEDNDIIPEATGPEKLPAENGAFISVIEGRPDIAADEIKNRAVKKTLTIPHWLNVESERRGINFSQTLQKALREQLGA